MSGQFNKNNFEQNPSNLKKKYNTKGWDSIRLNEITITAENCSTSKNKNQNQTCQATF